MIHEDEATSYKLIYAAGKIAVTDAKLYAYFHKPGSITRKAFSVSRLDLLPIMKERAEFFEEKRLDSLALRTWEKYYFLLASSLYHVKNLSLTHTRFKSSSAESCPARSKPNKKQTDERLHAAKAYFSAACAGDLYAAAARQRHIACVKQKGAIK